MSDNLHKNAVTFATAFVHALRQRGRTYLRVSSDKDMWNHAIQMNDDEFTVLSWSFVQLSLNFQPDRLVEACAELSRAVVDHGVIQFAQASPRYSDFLVWQQVQVVDPERHIAVLVIGPEFMRPSWRVDLYVRCEPYLGFQFI